MKKRTRHECKPAEAGKLPAPKAMLIALSNFRATAFRVPIRKFHSQKSAVKQSATHSSETKTKLISERTTQV
jgi:hypothetical protein